MTPEAEPETAPKVRDWLPGFLLEHAGRFPSADWPAPDSEAGALLLADWLEALAAATVTRDEAARASSRMKLNPPRFRDGHLPALIGMVNTSRFERGQSDPAATLEGARLASKACPHCSGGGFATVYHPDPPDGRKALSFAAHCVCPFGRFMRAKLKADDLNLYIDFNEVLCGRTRWLIDMPGLGPYLERFREADPLKILKSQLNAERFREIGRTPGRQPFQPRPIIEPPKLTPDDLAKANRERIRQLQALKPSTE